MSLYNIDYVWNSHIKFARVKVSSWISLLSCDITFGFKITHKDVNTE